MRILRRPPLGQSFADHQGGTYGSVFLERVQDAAGEANIPWVTLLAYAVAHEVGHLLLGAEAHTAKGLMKASWDRKDYVEMSQSHFHFGKEQLRQFAGPIRRCQVTRFQFRYCTYRYTLNSQGQASRVTHSNHSVPRT